MSEGLSPFTGSGESITPVSFEFLYGVASGRLQEALQLQQNARYRHAWTEFDPDTARTHVGFRLVSDFSGYMAGNPHSLDVELPVREVMYDESKLLVAAQIIDGQDAYFVVNATNMQTGQSSRYVVNPSTAPGLDMAIDPEVHHLDSKLLTYTIAPFRLQEQSA